MEPIGSGRPANDTRIADVTDLNGSCLDNDLQLQWTWPKDKNVRMVTIAFRTDEFPEGPEDLAAKRRTCSFEQFNLHGFRTLIPECERVFVAVYGRTNSEGTFRYSAGVCREIAARKRRRVYYHIDPPGHDLLAGVLSLLDGHGATHVEGAMPYQLILTTDKRTVLPALVLRHKQDGLPQHPLDGDKLGVVPAGQELAENDSLAFEFEPLRPLETPKARLFCIHDEDCHWLELCAR